jgi:hypothetical protein
VRSGKALQLLVKLAGRARNEDAAGNATFPVFHPLYNPRRFAALRAVGALGCVHYFFTVRCLSDLRHQFLLFEKLFYMTFTIAAVCGWRRDDLREARTSIPSLPISFLQAENL